MEESINGFEFLEKLRRENGKQVQNYRELSKYLDFKAREKRVPISGQFELTPLCNFDCKMCYVHLDPDQIKGRSVLSVSTWKDLIHQAWDAGMMHAVLTGGECLSYPWFDELYLYLCDLGCDIGILTNGFLLNEKRILFFSEHKPKRMQITLYGCNDDVYERVTGYRAFSTVIRNVHNAIAAGLPISLNVTPNRFLGEDVFETIRLARKMTRAVTVNSTVFSPREETGRSSQNDNPDIDHYVRIYQLMNELDGRETKEIEAEKLPPVGGPSHECSECGLRCAGGRASFVIDWKGKMLPCNRMNMICADTILEGFNAAWEKVNQAANNWPRVPECIGCPYDDICSNCMGNILQYSEPGKQPLALCEQTKYYVQHGVRHIPGCE